MATPLQTFVSEYARIRAAEGHGFATVEELRALPRVDRNHRHAAIWRIRRRSYGVLVDRVLTQFDKPLRILDLGAGCGWLTYRLSSLGHDVIAVDINSDSEDGLGAAGRLGCRSILADFDRLPLSERHADLAIFNGSFHYSTDYRRTLREAFRVAPLVVIMDSPIYYDETSGIRMVAEQSARSAAIACKQFLTWTELAALGHWRVFHPWYGLRWAMRPMIAKLRGHREPATFALLLQSRSV
jgi:SAM-dependent methyltransferase